MSYDESATSKTRIYEGVNLSKATVNMSNIPDALAHEQLIKTWNNYTIAESQSEKWLMMLVYRLARAMKFFKHTAYAAAKCVEF